MNSRYSDQSGQYERSSRDYEHPQDTRGSRGRDDRTPLRGDEQRMGQRDWQRSGQDQEAMARWSDEGGGQTQSRGNYGPYGSQGQYGQGRSPYAGYSTGQSQYQGGAHGGSWYGQDPSQGYYGTGYSGYGPYGQNPQQPGYSSYQTVTQGYGTPSASYGQGIYGQVGPEHPSQQYGGQPGHAAYAPYGNPMGQRSPYGSQPYGQSQRPEYGAPYGAQDPYGTQHTYGAPGGQGAYYAQDSSGQRGTGAYGASGYGQPQGSWGTSGEGGTYGGGYASGAQQNYGESASYGRAAFNERAGAGSYGQGTQGFRGRGPKGYARSDDRLREDICERLTDDPYIDASGIDVTVSQGAITIEGDVESRWMKHRIEDLVDSCQGVKTIDNRLRVAGMRAEDPESRAAGGSRPGGTPGTGGSPNAPGTGTASGTGTTPGTPGESKTSRH